VKTEGVPKTAGQRFSTGQPKIDTFSLRYNWLRTRVMLALGGTVRTAPISCNAVAGARRRNAEASLR